MQWSKISDDVREFRSIDNSIDGGLIMSSTGGTGGLEFGLKKIDEDGNACCTLNPYGSQNDGTTFSNVTVSEHNQSATITDATMDETTFTPTVNITSCNESGIKETGIRNRLSIFPDPADQFAVCNMYLATKEKTILTVIDMTGKQIFKSKIQNLQILLGQAPSEIIDVSQWKSGIYFCELQSGSQVVVTKFVVQH
jgi:hypothetical protein